MRKILNTLLVGLLVLSAFSLALADGDGADGGLDIIVDQDNAPVIFSDPTDRIWNPNDQTYKTASDEAFGELIENAFCDEAFSVPIRGNYLFTGETVSYYIGVYDKDGADNLDEVTLQKDGVSVGSCSAIPTTQTECGAFSSNAWVNEHFGIVENAEEVPAYSGATADDWAFYRCTLVVQSVWSEASEISVEATDEEGNSANTVWVDFLTMNPPLNVDLAGQISFGTVEAGTTVTSNSVRLDNVGDNGVMMDMYIAATDYFTDPSNGAAICGIANGIPHCALKYKATKGSVNSGLNDNAFPVLGLDSIPSFLVPGCTAMGIEAEDIDCTAEDDEYTRVPSNSGDIEDMCRIINHEALASVLSQGQSMTLTFRLNVPSPCNGAFTRGRVHLVGRVV